MLDKLYADIGAKIKKWAKWIFIVEAISAIIGGIELMINDAAFIGLVVLICGPLVAWVSSWLLFAFGQLVEDIHAMRNKEGTTDEVAAKREAEEKARLKAELKAQQAAEEAERLSISDIESAASAFLNRRVSISDITCTLIYVIPKRTGIPQEMHLDMSVGDTGFTSLDLFFDQKRKAYFFNGHQLALNGKWHSEEEIFEFNVSKFKEFHTEVDEDE